MPRSRPARRPHSQHTLGKDGGHAKEGRELHPYQGPWPAGDQSRGYPHNIAGADGGCQGRHQGGEGGDTLPARSAGFPPQRGAQGIAQPPPGKKPQADGQIDSATQQQGQCGGAPQGIIERIQHGTASSLLPCYAAAGEKIPAERTCILPESEKQRPVEPATGR